LHALGYQVAMIYEKYRSIYDLGGTLIMLDEMPFGNFTELEGKTPQAVRELSMILGLQWDRRINDSYVMLFDRLKAALNLDMRDLSFEQFQSLQIQPEMLSVQPGDAD
jgi:adenylate cyclase class 2